MDRRVETKSRGRLWVLLGAGVVVLAVVVGLYARYALTRSVTVSEARVVIAPVKRGVFTEYVPATAVVAPRKTVYLDAMEGGQIIEHLVEEGAFVTQGQVSLKLKNTNLQLEMLGRQAQLMEPTRPPQSDDPGFRAGTRHAQGRADREQRPDRDADPAIAAARSVTMAKC